MKINSERREPKVPGDQRAPVEEEDLVENTGILQEGEFFGDFEGSSEIDPQKIAALAYRYWEERGRPESSPEQDWFRAEETLRREWKKRNEA
jgi:hypothetical protein